METMSSVVKSKSSNSAQTYRSEHHNKKSRSNAEFQQPIVLKKRGVYVEKKPSKMGIDEPGTNQVQERPVKAPPRPRPGNKKFLASVLTILAKSTTGTQFPDANDPISKRKARRRIIRNNPIDTDNKDFNKGDKAKTKYRSKALNDEVNKEVNREQVVVLQSKKEMVQTPSMYSENDPFNLSDLPLLVKKDHENKEVIANNVKEVANELTRQIMEGQKSRQGKRVRIDGDESTTLVSNYAKTKRANKNDKGLYNFFVDLLETTISVYNVKTEYDKTNYSPSESSTKFPMEIDEYVAKKLNVNITNTQDTEEAKPSTQFFCLKDLEFGQPDNFPPYWDTPSKRPRKKKLQAESFSFLRKPTTRQMKTVSLFDTKKFSRKEKKKTLINLFKEQLRMDDDEFEEPKNLYQALKVIAQNKRRCQKTIHFEGLSRRKHDDMGFPDCMYKGRKVISLSTKSTKNKNKKPLYAPSIDRNSELSCLTKNDEYVSDTDQSHHSLEVYGFDYEHPIATQPYYNRDNQFGLRYHTPSVNASYASGFDYKPSERKPYIRDNELGLKYHSPSVSASQASAGPKVDLDFTDSMFFNDLLIHTRTDKRFTKS